MQAVDIEFDDLNNISETFKFIPILISSFI